MTLDFRLKPEEIFPVAIRAELDAAALYHGLHGRIKNEVLKQKLDFLAREEERHKAILERLFADRLPGKKLEIPAPAQGPRKAVAVEETTAVIDLFKLAMLKEKEAEEFYRDSRARMEDAGSKKVLDYLSRVERSHYFMLKSEIDILERFPEYFDADDFHVGQDLFHVGP